MSFHIGTAFIFFKLSFDEILTGFFLLLFFWKRENEILSLHNGTKRLDTLNILSGGVAWICHQLIFSTIADVLQCVSCFSSVCTLSFQREQQKSSFFLDTTRSLLCKCFLFLFPLLYTRAGTQKLFQMVNLIIETKEPNGSPSSLHASGSEKRNHLWELI